MLCEDELKAALIRLNPEIQAKNELADEVMYKLWAILISVNQVGLVKANEEFFKWLTGAKKPCLLEKTIAVFQFEFYILMTSEK